MKTQFSRAEGNLAIQTYAASQTQGDDNPNGENEDTINTICSDMDITKKTSLNNALFYKHFLPNIQFHSCFKPNSFQFFYS
jgi:hypothetical protein